MGYKAPSLGRNDGVAQMLPKVKKIFSSKQGSKLAAARGQLELPIAREINPDRNADKGGRSFYFFDFDDNVAFLATPAYIFHKETGEELKLSSGEFAQVYRHVGKRGPYGDYRLDYDELKGTFRNFRDREFGVVERLLGAKQVFVQDLAAALGQPDFQWKGPSWSCFFHATLNRRPLSMITARGHHPETIKEGLRLLVDRSLLPNEPNYLSIYPVMNQRVRRDLGDHEMKLPVPDLKQAAIRRSVERAIEIYGPSPYHRFGMSDDDPHNIELIVREMTMLKNRFPEMSFFVIETQHGHFVKYEVFPDRTEATYCASGQDLAALEQLSLFTMK